MCWLGAGVFTVVWVLTIYFHTSAFLFTGTLDIVDGAFVIRCRERPTHNDSERWIAVGRIDRAGEVTWPQRLGLRFPSFSYSDYWQPTRWVLITIPCWTVVGFHALIAARLRRRRLHQLPPPRSPRRTAVLWTLAAACVAAGAFFAAMVDISVGGNESFVAAKCNRFGVAWNLERPGSYMGMFHGGANVSWDKQWAIEPPVFFATTDDHFKPVFLLVVPTWMPLLFCSYMAVRAWRRAKPLAPNLCVQCRYDLTGNTSGRCSECGRVIDWDIHGTRQ